MLKKDYSKDGKTCVVTFIVPPEAAKQAKSVHLVGDFNDWNVSATPMARKSDGSFEYVVKLESCREYLFRYLVDGDRWENDWNADKYMPSPFRDADNSVIIV